MIKLPGFIMIRESDSRKTALIKLLPVVIVAVSMFPIYLIVCAISYFRLLFSDVIYTIKHRQPNAADHGAAEKT